MAELCKKCFIETWLTSSEKAQYQNGHLEIIETNDVDFCEGCCNITKVVDYIKYKGE